MINTGGSEEPSKRKSVQTQVHSEECTVGIATGYGLRSSGPGRVKNFLLFMSSRPALGSTQPPIQRIPGVKRAGREADHSPLTSGGQQNVDLHIQPPIRLHGVVLN
jgi:hypothetical protein